MGRNPYVHTNLPPRMRARRQRSGRVFYYYDTGEKPRREIPLGDDYVLAVQQWSTLHVAPPPMSMTVGWVIGKYLVSDDYAALGAGTQADYKFALDKLTEAFGDAPLDQVKPSHVVLYIDKRSGESKHRAQRERAILSMVYRWAMARDYCTFNPVAPVKGKRLAGRKNVIISDDMFAAVYEQAGQPLRDAIDLAYYTGQRPSDVLGLSETNIRDGFLCLRQQKTDTPLRIAIAGGLAELIERMAKRKASFSVRPLSLLVDERGQRMTKAKLRSRFETAREAAGITGDLFQFRDLRRKAGTDLREQASLDAAQSLLGHATQAMTEHYTGAKGKKVSVLPEKKAR